MPVTSKKLQIYQVSGAGKTGPTNLRWDNAKKQLVNILCECIVPSPITIEYTVAGTYTDILPSLSSRYVWQLSGTLVSGGGGGGGGGGGLPTIFGGPGTPGGGGFTSNVFSVPFNTILPSGATVTSVVGAGGAGGLGGAPRTLGLSGGIGSSSSVNGSPSPIAIGGFGGLIIGTPAGQPGGTQPGSGGNGGNGSIDGTAPGGAGEPGKDGRVVFTATPIYL
jgi:hypothetical protein